MSGLSPKRSTRREFCQSVNLIWAFMGGLECPLRVNCRSLQPKNSKLPNGRIATTSGWPILRLPVAVTRQFFVVINHAEPQGNAVHEVEVRRDKRDVENVLVAETDGTQLTEIAKIVEEADHL